MIDELKEQEDINLTLFLRKKKRLKNSNISEATIIEGDVLDYTKLKDAIEVQDIVYGNLVGKLGKMAETGVSKLIFICSIGIYDEPVKSALKSYRAAADVIEASDLDYTIVRPSWFTHSDEVDYEISRKDEPEGKGRISRKSIADFISKIIDSPKDYTRQSLGINKPGT